MSFSVVPSEVAGVASNFFSGIPSGAQPSLSLESGITCRLPLPPADHPRSTLSHLAHEGGDVSAAPSCGVLGRDSDQVTHHSECWLWQLQGRCVPRGVRATVYGACLHCPLFFFLPTPEVTGVTGGTHSRPQVVAGLSLSQPPVGHARGTTSQVAP